MLPADTELCDLHIHVGASLAPHILWSIAHEHGFKLPVKDYWEFRDLVTARPEKVQSLGDYLEILHAWTEKIQSSPSAIERSVHEIIGKEYRSSRVSHIELRFNPMKRNAEGEMVLDYIIIAALRGMERAMMEYGCRAGLIFCLAREFDLAKNEILVRKAERYQRRGVVGIDLAGPEKHTIELGADVAGYRELFDRARRAGLGTTIHTGETAHTAAAGVLAVIEELRPDRIGHGVAAADDPEITAKLAERGITLELCPSSNLRTRAVADLDDLGRVIGVFQQAGVRYTINTDGTYLLGTNLRREFRMLLDAGILTPADVEKCLRTARAASFIR